MHFQSKSVILSAAHSLFGREKRFHIPCKMTDEHIKWNPGADAAL